MKCARNIFLTASVLVICAWPAYAESLTCSQTLHFGTFAACGSMQSATLDPAGAITPTGCLTPMGGHMPGRCRLSDITDTSVIAISGNGDLETGAGANMTIDQFMLRPLSGGAAQPTIDVTSDLIGSDFDFTVGATLHINGTQEGGAYNGTYTLTINFY